MTSSSTSHVPRRTATRWIYGRRRAVAPYGRMRGNVAPPTSNVRTCSQRGHVLSLSLDKLQRQVVDEWWMACGKPPRTRFLYLLHNFNNGATVTIKGLLKLRIHVALSMYFLSNNVHGLILGKILTVWQTQGSHLLTPRLACFHVFWLADAGVTFRPTKRPGLHVSTSFDWQTQGSQVGLLNAQACMFWRLLAQASKSVTDSQANDSKRNKSHRML